MRRARIAPEREEMLDILDTMILVKRLWDISDLPLDLVTQDFPTLGIEPFGTENRLYLCRSKYDRNHEIRQKFDAGAIASSLQSVQILSVGKSCLVT